MSDPQLHPKVLFRTVAQGLPSLPDATLQGGTFCLVTDATPPSLAVLKIIAGVQTWCVVGGAGVPGVVNVMQFAVTTAVTSESVDNVPAGAVVLYRSVEIVTPFTGGTTMQLGNSASADLLIDAATITADLVDNYSAQDPVAWGGTARKVRATVAGGPVAGAAIATVVFAIPIN